MEDEQSMNETFGNIIIRELQYLGHTYDAMTTV